MRHAAQLFCLLVLVGCSSKGEGAAPAGNQVSFTGFRITAGLNCAPEAGLLGCLREHEPVSRQGAESLPTRNGPRLCVPVRSASSCFDDLHGLSYALLGKARDKFIVVETEDTGGFTVILVDEATSGRLRVDNRPLFSPDGSLFATVSYDIDAGYMPNRVVVWDAALEQPVHQVDGFPAGEGPIAIRWLAPGRLQVRYSRDHHAPVQDDTNTFFVWRDAEGRWHDDYKR